MPAMKHKLKHTQIPPEINKPNAFLKKKKPKTYLQKFECFTETFIWVNDDVLLTKKMANKNHSENVESKLLKTIPISYILAPLSHLNHKLCTLCCFW